MHPSQKVIHAEISDDDRDEGTDHVAMVAEGFSEKSARRLVERGGINHECDERPRLLGIP